MVAEPPIQLLPAPGLLIGDRRVESSSGGKHLHTYPATGKPTGEVVLAGAAEVDEAVAAARAAAAPWRTLSVGERRDLLLRLADLVLAHADELRDLQILEIGVPRQLARHMPAITADHLRYNAGWLDKIGGDVVSTWPVRALDYTLDEPYGVVGIIIPWNGSLVSMGQMLGPALAAGNTVVVKPPELSPFVPLRFGELVRAAGFPPGVVNVVPGGPLAGEALAGHPGVDKLHFTGSGATARTVLAKAQEHLTPVGLELGGKSAHVLFADTDVKLAARLAITGAAALSGQGCANGTRVLVQAPIYDEVLDIMTSRLRRLPVGDPFADRTVIGPVISAEACERILGVIDDATRRASGRLVLGGQRLGGELADGYYLEPTVFADVVPGSDLVQEEIFGPVLSVQPFSSEEEAVELANGTRYGLAAYLHTNDLRRTHRVSAALAAGTVWVNGTPGLLPSAPFGGTRQSGYGRIGGLAGVREFLRPKNIWIAT